VNILRLAKQVTRNGDVDLEEFHAVIMEMIGFSMGEVNRAIFEERLRELRTEIERRLLEAREHK
jgi:hypothetical protein